MSLDGEIGRLVRVNPEHVTQLRLPADDEDDSDVEDEEVAKPTTQLAVRRSGKQLAAGTGKYLRP